MINTLFKFRSGKEHVQSIPEWVAARDEVTGELPLPFEHPRNPVEAKIRKHSRKIFKRVEPLPDGTPVFEEVEV